MNTFENIDAKIATLYEASNDVLAHRYEAFRETLTVQEAWFALWHWISEIAKKDGGTL